MQGKQEVMLRIIMTLLLATMGTDALAEGRALSPIGHFQHKRLHSHD
jgi:hypothetical protein